MPIQWNSTSSGVKPKLRQYYDELQCWLVRQAQTQKKKREKKEAI